MKKLWAALKSVVIPITLTFSFAMSVIYYKNNYKQVSHDLALNKIGIGQANAAEVVPEYKPQKINVVLAPKRQLPVMTISQKPVNKKVSKNQPMYVEEVR